ncbi:hypothetical protein M446_6878 [Methylobacterium sp. 4-46]|uniref:hypothetical protein n=1 Tax=unclassified Methylobacterium TaxID=2615210 RepID=UPI000165CB06|nr:hypothetical protein [Methylobacterium sp. 4-46]ACA21121.1 hypothetical protein M446_6878 [Methylobacterium sp. 4-46]
MPTADPAALVSAWNHGLASLSPGQPPCPGFRPDEWGTTLETCRRFVDEFGAEAAHLGWDTLTLSSAHPQAGIVRGDWCGVMMPCSYPVFEVTEAYLKKHLWTSWKRKPGATAACPFGSSSVAEAATIERLYKRKLITDEQLDAVVMNFLNAPKPGARPLVEGVAIDVCAIMAANPHAREVLAARDSSEAEIRMAVRTAILMAQPA